MNILDVLNESCIDTHVRAATRDEVLHRIAELAKSDKTLKRYSTDEIFDALAERERQGSTGFGGGIAIPHCSFTDLDRFVVGFCRIPEGSEFETSDGEPVYILFFIIGPASERNRHIQVLSSVSKILNDPDNVAALRKAVNVDEVLKIVKKEVGVSSEFESQSERCLLQIIIQREEYFDEVMSILSAEVQGEIVVLEARNAGHYLHRMPLFSAYLGRDTHNFCRVILAMVDRRVCNDIIRRIHLIRDDIEEEGGMLVAAIDLLYSGGSLDF